MRSIPSRVLSLRLTQDFYDAIRALPGFENPSDAARALLLEALEKPGNSPDESLAALDARIARIEHLLNHLFLNTTALRAEVLGADVAEAVEQAQHFIDHCPSATSEAPSERSDDSEDVA